MGDVKVTETVNWTKLPPKRPVLIAYADCPECGTTLIVQPVPGYFTTCPQCGEIIVVFVLPLLLNGEQHVCVLEAMIKDGRGCMLRIPGIFEFGEWVL